MFEATSGESIPENEKRNIFTVKLFIACGSLFQEMNVVFFPRF